MWFFHDTNMQLHLRIKKNILKNKYGVFLINYTAHSYRRAGKWERLYNGLNTELYFFFGWHARQIRD